MSDQPSSAVRPRVLQCVTHLALGGAERVALTIAESLRTEFEFGVFAVRGIGDGTVGATLHQELRTLDVPFYRGPRVPMRFGGMLTGAFALSRAVRAFRPDLIHLHTEIPEASYATLAAARRSVAALPLVRTIHNSVFWEFWRPLGRWCDRRMARSYCACVSQDAVEAMRRLRRDSHAPALPQPPVLIYSGIADSAPQPVRQRGPNDPFHLVFGGRFELEKGADLLPEIVRRVQLPAGRSATLTIFGSGSHEPALRALAAAPPPGWTIEVKAPVADFRAQLADYHIALVPSRFEGLGLVAVEATLAGLPVVATQAPGLREALPPDYPWRSGPGDAAGFASVLSDALGNPGRWADAVRAAQQFALTRFSVEAMRNGYHALYAAALQHTPRPTSPRG